MARSFGSSASRLGPPPRPARLAPAARPGFCRTRPTPRLARPAPSGSPAPPARPHLRLARTPGSPAPLPGSHRTSDPPRTPGSPHIPARWARPAWIAGACPFFASNGQKRAGLAICRMAQTLRFGFLAEKSLVASPPNSAKRFDDCQTGSFLTFEGLFGVRGEASAGFPGAFHAGRAASHARKAARCASAPRAASAGSARRGRAR